MKNQHLQSLIALNAVHITNTGIVIGSMRDTAQYLKATGEIAFGIDMHKQADRHCRKLAKAVEMQQALKTELAHNFRVSRIAAKTAKLESIMGTYTPPAGQTSYETEAYLDTMIACLVPKKVDSRLNTVVEQAA